MDHSREGGEWAKLEAFLKNYRDEILVEHRAQMAGALLARARRASTSPVVGTLLYLLNDENDTPIRTAIVEYLAETRPPSALPALVKALFDPSSAVRARAAAGVAGYRVRELLGDHLWALIEASRDPIVESPLRDVVAIAAGKPLAKISLSERERLRIGDHARHVFADYYATPYPEGEPTRPPDNMPAVEPLPWEEGGDGAA